MPKPSDFFTFRVIHFVILSCLPLGFWGQEDTAYVRTYGGPYFEEGRQIIECASGGYAVIGTTGSDVANNTNFYLLRLDASLECMWSKSLGGLEVEKGYSIVEDENENLFLCGYTNSEGAGGYDVLLIKTNSDGDELWRKTYGGEDWDFGYKIIKHPEGGFLICGKTYSMGNGGSDAYLLHVDDAGAIISEWTYGAEGDDEFVDVVSTSNDSFQLVYNRNANSSTRSFSLVEIDFSGLIVWTFEKDFEGAISDGHAIEKYEEGFIVVGSRIHELIERGFFIVIDENGNETNYGTVETDYSFTFNDVVIKDDIAILPGKTNGFGAGEEDAVIYYFNFDNIFIGAPTYGGENNDEMISSILNSNNELISVGGITNTTYQTSQLLVTRHTAVVSGDYFQVFDYDGSCLTTGIESELTDTTKKEIRSITFYNTIGQYLGTEISINSTQIDQIIIKETIYRDNTRSYTKFLFSRR